MSFRPLDPTRDVDRRRNHLPHWKQKDATCFVTFRLADAIPQTKLQAWEAQRSSWLRAHGIQPGCSLTFEDLADHLRHEYHRRFTISFHRWLDAGEGSCVLRQACCAVVVADALHFFDIQRYVLEAFVVMPNHVHVLATPHPDHDLSEILHSWKSYTSNELNKLLCQQGQLWQKESYDHLVRSEEQFSHYRRYIRDNPIKARLREGEYLYWDALGTPD